MNKKAVRKTVEEINDDVIPMSQVAPQAKPQGGMSHGLRQQEAKEVKETQKLPPAPRSELQRMGHMKY